MPPIASFIAARAAVAVAIAAGSLAITPNEASAVSFRVKMACAADYYRHCSAYSPGSKATRKCMRKVGKGLSRRCATALHSEGEMSSADFARYNSATRTASR